MCVREHMCVPFDVRVYVHVYAIRVQVAKHLVVLLVLLANIRELWCMISQTLHHNHVLLPSILEEFYEIGVQGVEVSFHLKFQSSHTRPVMVHTSPCSIESYIAIVMCQTDNFAIFPQ